MGLLLMAAAGGSQAAASSPTAGGSASADAVADRYKRSLSSGTRESDEALKARYGIGASSQVNATGKAVGQTWAGGGRGAAEGGAEPLDSSDAALLNRYRSAGTAGALGGQASAASPDTAAFVSGVLGVESATATNRGITEAGAGTTQIATRYTATLPCTNAESNVSIGTYSGKFSCGSNNTAVLLLCPQGTFCTRDDQFIRLNARPGAPASAQGLKLEASFTGTGARRSATLQLSGSSSIEATAQKSTPASAYTEGSYLGVVQAGSSGERYNEAMNTHGRASLRCLQYAKDGKTCLFQEQANLGTLASGSETSTTGSCDSPVCERQTTSTRTWTESCNRGVDATTYNCTYVRVPLSCTVETGTSRQCSGGITDPESQGYAMTGSESVEIDCPEGTPSGTVCERTTESWIGPETLQGSCQAYPLPIYGGSPATSCENKGQGLYRASCSGWYGRTLTEAACTTAGDDESDPYELDESLKPGCGYCLRSEYVDSCIAEAPVSDASCPAASKPACSLSAVTCLESSVVGSTPICYAQREEYSCSETTTSCASWSQPASCSGAADLSGGTSRIPVSSGASGMGGFGQAAASLGVADAVAQSVTDEMSEMEDLAWFMQNGGLPKVFNGENYRCSEGRLRGVGAGVNCCSIRLERPEAGLANSCDLDDVKLAALRRKNQAYYVGRYCAKSVKILGRKTCIERAQSYCTYDGILPRIIQEQGRQQLAQFAAQDVSGAVSRASSVLGYYGAGAGGWSAPISAGRDITVRRWQWPAACQAGVLTVDAAQASGDQLLDCPSVPDVYWATCVAGTPGADCSTPPSSPLDSADGWTIGRTNPLRDETTPIHRLAWVTGSCDTGTDNCAYEVQAWPASTGGRAVLSRDTEFQATTGEAAPSGESALEGGELSIIGNTIVRPAIYRTAGPAPAQIPVQYSTDNGLTWGQLLLPAMPEGAPGEVSIPGSDEGVSVQLSCEDAVGFGGDALRLCRLRSVGTVVVTTKPWGAPKRPDCKGFTMGQFSVLDFERMDFSEWIAELTDELGGKLDNIASEVGSQALAMADSYFAHYGGGVASDSTSYGAGNSVAPQSSQSVWITPREDYGPFDAKIRVVSNWPRGFEDSTQNTNPVTRVVVDWNDCTAPELLVPTLRNGEAAEFTGTHRFASPDQIGCGIGGKRDIEHQVKVTVTARDGTHEVFYKVRNVWKDFKGNVTQEREGSSNAIKQGNVTGSDTSDRGTVLHRESVESQQIQGSAPGSGIFREEAGRQ